MINRSYFEYAGAAGGFIDKYGYPFCRGRIISHIEEDHGQYDDSNDIFWASGACMLVRSELYFTSGGLDPFFFAHMEEIDLCWRIKNMGWRIRFCHQSEVFHLGGGTLPKSNHKKTYLNFRNNLILIIKNTPDDDLAAYLYYSSVPRRYSSFLLLGENGSGGNICCYPGILIFIKTLPHNIKITQRTDEKNQTWFS